ncbi:MAG: hypothetical protein J6N77_01480 [Lachnospiraceae bacterium]|nr:hypothetical protein [Lachnospiraceae bacterium]
MSIEHMKRISAAEEEAVSIRRQAQVEVRRLTEKGRKDAADLLDQAKKQAEARYQEAVRTAETEAGASYEARLTEVAKECEALKALAANKIPEAVEVIKGKVVKSSVNR